MSKHSPQASPSVTDTVTPVIFPDIGDRIDTKAVPDIGDRIDTKADEAIALLHMLRVFCNLEKRDMDAGRVDGTLADAADGLEILMRDIADRVEAVKDDADQLYELAVAKDGGAA